MTDQSNPVQYFFHIPSQNRFCEPFPLSVRVRCKKQACSLSEQARIQDLLIARYGDSSLDRCLHDYWTGVRNG